MSIMTTALDKDKIVGVMGISAVAIFIVTMIAAAFTADGFSFGTSMISDMYTEPIFIVGCVIAGVLGTLFGLSFILKKEESDTFIGKIRAILMIISGIALVVLGLTKGNDWTVYLFIAMITLSALSDTLYNWVADQKVMMIFSLLLTLVMALTGVLSQTGDNSMMGFLFVLFVSLWVFFVAAIRLAPVVEAEPERPKKAKTKEEPKKNAPAPRPYPLKKEAPAAKPVGKEEAKKPVPKKAEEPKKAVEEAVPENKDELPKLKVMSSKKAAAVRETVRKKEETETPQSAVIEEPVEIKEAKPIEEPVKAEEAKPIEAEPTAVEEAEYETESYDEDEFGLAEDTPDALLRRATWNKGLRCRRDYGEHKIQIAYVKAKVAVYVDKEKGDTSADDLLRSEGWTVLRYLESEISDGKEQADEINRAVKESLKAERAAKKKKSTKK